ncbi:hypothetical protein [Planococcus salinarum]|uniref:hypothetical protein n=1 Tax=Planococcus salinarum TaxID=622695 RepID=UPI000E3B73DA|nr:hypothetical protein [Planococcus salinarum]TAA69656.1 hypothetical protein D2909_12840 [Planococcus salinarum]
MNRNVNETNIVPVAANKRGGDLLSDDIVGNKKRFIYINIILIWKCSPLFRLLPFQNAAVLPGPEKDFWFGKKKGQSLIISDRMDLL